MDDCVCIQHRRTPRHAQATTLRRGAPHQFTQYAGAAHCVTGYAGKPAGVSDTSAGLLAKTLGVTNFAPLRSIKISTPAIL
jgi:hypothetical protein